MVMEMLQDQEGYVNQWEAGKGVREQFFSWSKVKKGEQKTVVTQGTARGKSCEQEITQSMDSSGSPKDLQCQ